MTARAGPDRAEPPGTTAWDGAAYQERLDELAATGAHMHGEADLVMSYRPVTVLDAGCGTGRVAAELARRGVAVTAVDVDPSMLATARARVPGVRFVEADLAHLELGTTFDLVLLAGNVPLFTAPGTQRALIAGVARHLGPGGRMVAGFRTDHGYDTDRYDTDCSAAGLVLSERWATWERTPWTADATYAVSVHVRSPKGGGPLPRHVDPEPGSVIPGI